jgi:hypothetical protein
VEWEQWVDGKVFKRLGKEFWRISHFQSIGFISVGLAAQPRHDAMCARLFRLPMTPARLLAALSSSQRQL